MSKKILSVIVCICLVACVFASVALAGEFKTEEDKTYYYDDTNNIVVGWFSVEQEDKTVSWYFAGPDGTVQTGFVVINDQTYYFDPETFAMATGTTVIDGVEYTFSDDGIGDEAVVAAAAAAAADNDSTVPSFTVTEEGDVVNNDTQEAAPVTSPKPF